MAARLVQLRTTTDEVIHLNPTIVLFVKAAEQLGAVHVQVGQGVLDRFIVYGTLEGIVASLNEGLDPG